MSDYYYVLERLCKIMDNIEKDLHSIDVSLGKIVAQNEKNEPKNTLNELEYPEYKVEKNNFYVGDGVYEARTEKKMSWDEYFNDNSNECESGISKYQRQMAEQVISDMHVFINKEEQ